MEPPSVTTPPGKSPGVPRPTVRRFAAIASLAVLSAGLLLAVYVFAVCVLWWRDAAIPAAWLLNWLPALFYLWGLWVLRGMFARMATAQEPAELTLLATLRRLGLALILGAGSTAIPILNLFMGPPKPGGSLVIFAVPAATIFLLGALLMVLAPLLQRGAKSEAEAAKLKRELDGFF